MPLGPGPSLGDLRQGLCRRQTFLSMAVNNPPIGHLGSAYDSPMKTVREDMNGRGQNGAITARSRAKNARGRAQLLEFGEFARGKLLAGRTLTYGHRCAPENSRFDCNSPARPGDAGGRAQRTHSTCRKSAASSAELPIANVQFPIQRRREARVGSCRPLVVGRVCSFDIQHSSFDIAAPGCACFNAHSISKGPSTEFRTRRPP